MFELETQAAKIVAQLETVESIETVAYIDDEGQTARHPATMPAAFVMLAKLTRTEKKATSIVADLDWTILVKSMQLQGPGGSLPVIDLVLDTLGGFIPATGGSPLIPERVELLERRGEAIEYAVTFSTNRQAILRPKF